MSLKNLSYLPLSFIIGVAAVSFLSLSGLLYLLSLSTALGAGLLLSVLYYNQPDWKKHFHSTTRLLVSACLLTLILGGSLTARDLNRSVALLETSTWPATVVSQPIVRPANTQYRLRIDHQPMDTLITVSRDLDLSYGDTVKIIGQIKKPETFNDFDYPGFLRKENISHVAYYPTVKIIDSNPNRFYTKLFNLKSTLRQLLRKNLTYPHSAVIGAMTLGDNQLVPEEINQTFSRTGLRHIIAISGLHITIIIGLLLIFFTTLFRLPLAWAAGLTAGLIILYVIFVGAPASAVRAAVMGGISLWALTGGRQYMASRALLVAATGMLIFNPLLLKYDVGFQLSFAAMTGIIFIAPFIWWLLNRLPTPSFLSKTDSGDPSKPSPVESIFKTVYGLIAITLSAQLATWPLVVYHFGHLSLIGPLSNLLVMPIVPIMLSLSLLLLIAGWLTSALTLPLAWPVYLLTEYILRVSRGLEQLPAAHFELSDVHWLWPVTLYLLGGGLLLYLNRTELGQQILHKKLI